MRDSIGQAFLLMAVVFSVFSSSLGNGFVYDDHFQITANPYIKDFRFLETIFTTHVWHFSPETDSNNYRPLHLLAYLLLYETFGENPFAFHAAAVFFHAIAVVMLWRLFIVYAGTRTAFVASLLFAVHPVQVESVAWVGSYPNLLCAIFVFASLLAYLKGRLLFVPLLFLAGLLSKEHAVLLPLILIADQLMFRRYDRERFFVLIGTVVLACGLYLVLRENALGRALSLYDRSGSMIDQTISAISFLGLYVKLLIWPFPLNAYYGYTIPPPARLIASGVSFVILLGILIFLARRNRTAVFGALLFLILLLPVLWLRAVSTTLFAERYLYLPAAGFFLLIVAAIRNYRYAMALLIVIAVPLSVFSQQRSKIWHDDLSLWSDTYNKSPNVASVTYNLATAWMKQERYAQAAPLYERTVKLEPLWAEPYFNLAKCNHLLGDDVAAEKNLRLFLRYWKGDRKEAQRARHLLHELERQKKSK